MLVVLRRILLWFFFLVASYTTHRKIRVGISILRGTHSKKHEYKKKLRQVFSDIENKQLHFNSTARCWSPSGSWRRFMGHYFRLDVQELPIESKSYGVYQGLFTRRPILVGFHHAYRSQGLITRIPWISKNLSAVCETGSFQRTML